MTTPSQPRFEPVDSHIRLVQFQRRMSLIERFLDVFLEGEADEIRAKRDELQSGLSLLEDAEQIARCDKLIRALTAQLYIIPHERHLRRALRNGTFS